MRKSAPRLEYIDTLRGIACLWVVYCHVNSTWQNESVPLSFSVDSALSLLALAGWLGVFLFLVLSGFCLYYPLVRKDNYKIDLREFAIRRCRRILPPYYAAMVFVTILWIIMRARPGFSDLLVHALMIHNLHPAYVSSLNSDFWSLALEFHLYIVFPLIVLSMTKWGTRSVLIAAVLISAIYQLGVYAFFNHTIQANPLVGNVLYRTVIGGLSSFVCGMAAARLVLHPIPNQTRWAVLVCLLTLPFNVWGFLQIGKIVPVHHVTLGLFFASGIVIIAGYEAKKHAEDVQPSAIKKLAKPGWVFLTWVGGFSYSLYLIHHPLLYLTKPYIERFDWSRGVTFALFTVLGLPALIALAYGFFWAFERPFIGAKRKRQLEHVEPSEVPPVPASATSSVS